MLSDEQKTAFEEKGYVRVRGAFADAPAMEDRLWSVLEKKYGARRDDPDSWGVEFVSGLQSLRNSPPFQAIGSSRTRAAIDSLMGEGGWQQPKHWGQILVTFPSGSGAWEVPHRLWHTDFGFVAPTGRIFGVLLFGFLSEVPSQAGGTLIVEGSHRVVHRYVADAPAGKLARMKMKTVRLAILDGDPWLRALSSPKERTDRVPLFMDTPHESDGVSLRVVELTGEAGDVVLAHPWMLHCGSPNSGRSPRFMTVQRIRLASGRS